MDTLASAIAQVSAQIGSLAARCETNAKNKTEFAERCGLRSISDAGTFAAMVAVHDDLPDVVIKVVPAYDKYLDIARECLAGTLDHPMLPTFYSITDLGTHSIVVVQRIQHVIDACDTVLLGRIEAMDDDFCDDCDCDCDRSFMELMSDFCVRHDCMRDFHAGNFMTDDDGNLYCIDPVWSFKRSN